jgi:integrase
MSMEWSEISGNWRTIPEKKSKNGLEHRVLLSPMSHRIIAQLKSLTESKPSKYVFPSPKGDGHIENAQKAIQQIRKSAGISFVGHDPRRTARA